MGDKRLGYDMLIGGSLGGVIGGVIGTIHFLLSGDWPYALVLVLVAIVNAAIFYEVRRYR